MNGKEATSGKRYTCGQKRMFSTLGNNKGLAWLGEPDAEGGFGSLQRGGGMGYGADSADSGGDVGDIFIIPAAEHRFKKAGRLGNFPQQFLNFAVLSI